MASGLGVKSKAGRDSRLRSGANTRLVRSAFEERLEAADYMALDMIEAILKDLHHGKIIPIAFLTKGYDERPR